jgi:hypothetical protein
VLVAPQHFRVCHDDQMNLMLAGKTGKTLRYGDGAASGPYRIRLDNDGSATALRYQTASSSIRESGISKAIAYAEIGKRPNRCMRAGRPSTRASMLLSSMATA